MKDRRGFSLIELLIYVGILAASSTFLVGMLIIFTQIHLRQVSINEVNDQISFVNNTIERLVRESSLVDMTSGSATTTLTLRMASSTLDPTLIYYNSDNQAIYFQEGSNDPLRITDTNVNVTGFEVNKFENPGGHAIVQAFITVDYDTDNPRAEFKRTAQLAVSRVSAASFDSNLLPNADDSYDVGNTSQNWRDGYFSGEIGIGTIPVSNAKIKTTGDVAFTTSTKGIVFTTPDGTCLRFTMGNNGEISTSSIACP